MKSMESLRGSTVKEVRQPDEDTVIVTMPNGNEYAFDVVEFMDDWLYAHNKRIEDDVRDHDLWYRK